MRADVDTGFCLESLKSFHAYLTHSRKKKKVIPLNRYEDDYIVHARFPG